MSLLSRVWFLRRYVMREAKLLVVVSLLLMVVAGCNAQGSGAGTLQFYASGGDPVRVGMVSKDGWKMVFNHMFITVTDVTGYQSQPPYDPIYARDLIRYEKAAILPGPTTVDIAQNDPDGDGAVLVGEIADAEPGKYNAISWQMTPAAEGEYAGYALVLVGRALKDTETIDFTLKFDQVGGYLCGEYFRHGQGAAEKRGILEGGEIADLEMTFALDVLFGDGAQPAASILNRSALGFDPLAAMADDGILDVDTQELAGALSADLGQQLEAAIAELGMVGDGRCFHIVP